MAFNRLKRVLLTNDDGVAAPGLAALRRACEEIADEVWVVAPDHDKSGTSHSLSLHEPLRINDLGDHIYSVSGTPGDCAALAIRHLMLLSPPDLVISGINRGANLGNETVFSGTVGAAMTAMLLGIPAIAMSQAFSDRNKVPWDTSKRLAPKIIKALVSKGWARDVCLNVNIPDAVADNVQEIRTTTQGIGYLNDIHIVQGKDPRDLPYFWLKLARSTDNDSEGSEAAVLRSGAISVTPLSFERTNRRDVRALDIHFRL
ncbi:5'/3'-nucleotidase SurE [Rhizobium sp. RCC_161_2]|uniref:5'/3'-nucleotidase SurE n=1 Tax=Rhizobium sp. RCC_161_2 TaxID=3239219 RepID=UPI0035233D13